MQLPLTLKLSQRSSFPNELTAVHILYVSVCTSDDQLPCCRNTYMGLIVQVMQFNMHHDHSDQRNFMLLCVVAVLSRVFESVRAEHTRQIVGNISTMHHRLAVLAYIIDILSLWVCLCLVPRMFCCPAQLLEQHSLVLQLQRMTDAPASKCRAAAPESSAQKHSRAALQLPSH